MAAFNNGGGDLTATTLEAAFIEIALNCLSADQDLTTPTGNVSDDIAANGASTTISATLPVTQSLVAGKIQLTAVDYLSLPFDPGQGGTLVSTTWPAALLEITSRMQSLEIAQNLNVITMTLNVDAGTATITAPLGLTRTIGAGGTQVLSANTYLA